LHAQTGRATVFFSFASSAADDGETDAGLTVDRTIVLMDHRKTVLVL
jgi:hypothetical protein